MRVLAIIQARMGSSRLPGKVLMDLGGEPMLVRVVNRTRRTGTLNEVVVATTTKLGDAAIVELCATRGWQSFRGSEDDSLDRYYQAASQYGADVVVRITADCPLIEPGIVDTVVEQFLDLQPHLDYACNFLPRRTYPRGLDTEVMRFDALERAWREDQNPTWREHVTPYITRNPGLFQIHGVVNDVDYSFMRWTVDTVEDLELVRAVYQRLGNRDDFNWREAIGLMECSPELMEINRHVQQKETPG